MYCSLVTHKSKGDWELSVWSWEHGGVEINSFPLWSFGKHSWHLSVQSPDWYSQQHKNQFRKRTFLASGVPT